MSKLLDQLHDEKLDFTVKINVNGKKESFEFLDIVNWNNGQYAILAPLDEDYVEIFLILNCDCDNESYLPIENEETLESIFEIFKKKNEDEFDFE